MFRFALTLIFVCPLSSCLFANSETVLYDSNGFESPNFTTGNLSGQNGWTVQSLSSSAFSVESTLVASGSQAVQAFGGPGRDGSFAYPVLLYTPAANELIHIQADIARSTPSIATSASPVFAIDIYDFSQDRTTRFGLSSDTSGTISEFVSAPYNNGTNSFDPNSPVQIVPLGSPVSPNTFVHFDALLDYTSKTLSLTVDGTNYGTAIPFADPTAVNLAAATLEIGTFGVSTDSGYFDNYQVSVVTDPEPTSAALCVAAVGAFALWRGRKKLKVPNGERAAEKRYTVS